ncbi:MAG TPA: aldehyde dehydrogenase family protein [Longimicrobiaceae bacterium]|nr:aldehyde dehydrogenase family protein [Longimicrobiaceae bacterium]
MMQSQLDQTPSSRRLSHFIANEFVAGEGSDLIGDVNPSDARDVVAHLPTGTPADARRAAEAAAWALPAWKTLSGPARAELLHRWAAAIAERAEELAQTVAREVGKPIGESRGEVSRCVAILRYYAGDAVRSVGEVIPAQTAGALQFTLRDPLGVVALVTPWNFPIAIPLWKAAPALAFGNTVVLKPAESASLVAVQLAETAAAAGLPAGVFNVLLGSGAGVGEALIQDEAVRAVSFTGSTAVGGRVAALAAARNIRYQTEMGGKNVVIVAGDADLELAARLTAAGAMRYAGQKCTATSRAVVMRSVQDEFMARLRAEVERLPLGPVTDAAAAVGPLISAEARERVRSAVAGAESLRCCGGTLPSGDDFDHGYFVAPTVLRDVPPESPLAQDELFGPVLAVLPADDMDEAISLANRTRYGLSASLFTHDLSAAMEYVRRIEVGLVRVNGDTTGVDPHAPFGGLKASSSGSREQGPAAREFYTEIRTVQINA